MRKTYFRHLAIMALLMITIPAASARAGDESGRLIPAVSTERGTLLPAYTGCGGVWGVPSSNAGYEQEVVALVNAERASRSLPPLKRVSLLDEAARYHATDMAQDNYFEHDSYDRSGGSLVWVCYWYARIQSYYPNWLSLAENIAVGYSSPQSVMTAWMNSPGHRANILSTGNWEIGVGYYQGNYWVQDFGRRSGVYPIVINQEAAETDTRDVSLYIYGSGTWPEMRLRNDGGTWTGWQPFQSTLNWTLAAGQGEHTVWVELRNGGQTTTSSDTIFLNTDPTLGNLPDAVGFAYSTAEGGLLTEDYQATPLNMGSSDVLSWTVTVEGSWFTVAPTSGATPASFWITPTETTAPHAGAVTVTVTAPPGTSDSPHRIDLSLEITDAPFSYTYLPLALNSAQLYPDDAGYGSQWALEKINAPGAWAASKGQGVLIAVLDTGADLDHPDLAGKLRTDVDWDFVNGDGVSEDDEGHGTHVTGIAAAATDNGTGVAGVGWEATILPLKVLNASGKGDTIDLADAIRYAADNGAGVINMSLGGAFPCPSTVQDAVDYAYARGVVLVAAAGNDEGNTENAPANCAFALGVAATTSSDTHPSFSNYGNHVSVAAPGANIYSTMRGGGYGQMSGTSMATPHVAGLAALVQARYPAYTPGQVASAIMDNAVDLGAAGWDPYYGCGRIDAAQALAGGALFTTPLCIYGLVPWSTGTEAAALPDAPFVPGEIIVSLRPGVEAGRAVQRYGTDAEFLPRLSVWRVRVPAGAERATLARLQADPDVAYAELNYVVSAR